jgi:colicin import membrane protein
VEAATHIGFRRLGRGHVGGLLATLAIHGGIVGLVYYTQIRGPAVEEVPRDLMVTKIVTLGKPREKFWLPRIQQPPKPKVQQPVIKVAEDPNAAPAAPREAPKPEDAEISKDLRRALQRAKMLAQAAEDEPAEGSATGSELGTASEASEGDAYATAIFEAIRRNWVAPTGLVNDAELARLVAEVRVQIAEDGRLINPTLHKSSGNPYFDDSSVQAVKTTGRVPPPPPAQRARFRRGMALEFMGKELAR